MPRTRRRPGRSGHRDRKPITVAQVQRPIRAADRRALEHGKSAGQREHRAGLDAFARRVLGLDTKPGASTREEAA